MGCDTTRQPDQLSPMQSPPSIPLLADAPDQLLASGHLWILEYVAAPPVRFRLLESGLIQFGDGDRMYDDPSELGPAYQHTVRHIQSNLDRETLRVAVDDVSQIVCIGRAMQYAGIEYDWERTPSFLGYDVWSATTETFRPPDAVDGIYRRLGLEPAAVVDQELSTRDFDPRAYEQLRSAWYDGPAAGVVVRDKQGHRGLLATLAVDGEPAPPPQSTTATEIAGEYGSKKRFERLCEQIPDNTLSVDLLTARAAEAAFRQLDPRHFETVDHAAVRSALAERAHRFVNE